MITVIKTTERGARLITDGNKVAWIMGRYMRSDGTLTPMGQHALENGKTYADWLDEEKYREELKEAAREERRRQFEVSNEKIAVSIDARRIDNGTEKAWRLRTDATRRLYGKIVHVYDYLPKAHVKVAVNGTSATLTMPRWVLHSHSWMKEII